MNGIHVTGTMIPTSDLDTFAVTDEQYHKGGYRSVADSTGRYAISTERRSVGMLVKELSTGFYYSLEGGITNSHWKREFTETSSGGTGEYILSLENADLW